MPFALHHLILDPVNPLGIQDRTIYLIYGDRIFSFYCPTPGLDDMSLDTISRMRATYSRRLNKEFRSNLRGVYQYRQLAHVSRKSQHSNNCDISNNNRELSLYVNNVNTDNSSFHEYR